MASGTISVVVQNDAQFPLRNLVIAHRQGKNDGDAVNQTHQFNGIIRKGDPPQYLCNGKPLQFDQYYVHGDDHWVVTWENHCDLAVYYLYWDTGFLYKLERDLLDAMDDALEEALENPEILAVPLGGGAGTDKKSAALLLAEDILIKQDRHTYLDYGINSSDNQLLITLECNRATATFKNKKFEVKCHVYKCRS